MLISPGSLELPIPPETLFGREAPLALEIGFGGGSFLEHLSSTHPDWNVLGAELSLASVSRTYRRLRRNGAEHARLYRGHGRFLLRDVLPDRSIHRVYVNFPDPWPKERHQPRRLLQAAFFELLAARMEDKGALLFTTDHEAYFDFVLSEARQSGYFTIEEGPPPPAALRTKYARKWKAQEKRIFHARFNLRTRPSASPPRLIKKVEMHHAILEGDLPDVIASIQEPSIQQRFEKQVHRLNGHTVVLLEAFQNVSDKHLLIRTVIQEPDLRQDVMIDIRPNRGGGLFVGIAPFGSPLTTRGTSDAVRLVARWLVEQGCELVEEKY